MATLNDIKILLKNRVGFRKPIDGSFEALDADNELTSSDLVFQDAHSMVTIENIRDAQPLVGIDDTQLNTYLKNLRESNVLEVLNDVFRGQSSIDENLINSDLSVFDKAIYLRMVLKVGELIISSPRSSISTRLSSEAVNKLRLDLNGSNDGGYSNPNLPYHLGYTSRYRREIKFLESTFNSGYGELLNTVTLG